MGWIADLLKEIPTAARYKSDLEAMEKQNMSLKSENENLRQEIQRRDELVKRQESHGSRLEELRGKILVLVAQTARLSDSEIAAKLSISKTLATFHLHELKTERFVTSNPGLDENSYQIDVWFVEQPGRKYLVHHNLC